MLVKKILIYPLHLFFDKFFDPVYKKRLAKYITSLCDNNSDILDVGCDDGSVAKMIMEYNPSLKIVGIDIQSNRPSKISRRIYDGKKIPYPSNSFDVVIALDVLHHTKDILPLLREIKRVSKKYIIIKDHLVYSIFSKLLVSFTDYISNVHRGIKCNFNFPSLQKWNYYFNKLHLIKIERSKNLNFGFGINERYNPIFKLKKRR